MRSPDQGQCVSHSQADMRSVDSETPAYTTDLVSKARAIERLRKFIDKMREHKSPQGTVIDRDADFFVVEIDAVEECIKLIESLAPSSERPTEAGASEEARDAARYRWLREPQDHVAVSVEDENEDGFTGAHYSLVREELDAAIDAAMTGDR